MKDSHLTALSDRQKREKDYYEQYAEKLEPNRTVDFSPVTSHEQRPWNSYWEVYALCRGLFNQGTTILDFGCGPGDNAIRLAKIGYNVVGFDICANNIKSAQELFFNNPWAPESKFEVSTAEVLPYPDETFDVISGIDILHHVDIQRSIAECHRVLKTGGVAIFREPIEVPILDMIRNTWLLRLIVPKDASLESHITQDEAKLTEKDLALLGNIFSAFEFKRYFVLARLDRFYRKAGDPAPSILERIDYWLVKNVPGYSRLGGAVVIILKK
jgi:ubiquinone/menaquinone biosynthesis C-methylase UbiE